MTDPVTQVTQDHNNANSDKKSTFFLVTAFVQTDQDKLKSGNYPPFIKNVYGGMEQCPSTGRLHFQACIECNPRQRWKSIKKVFPVSDIRHSYKPVNAVKYVMKEETAVEEKQVIANQNEYIHLADQMQLMANIYVNIIMPRYFEKYDKFINISQYNIEARQITLDEINAYMEDKCYNAIVHEFLLWRPKLITLFTNPFVRKIWKEHSSVYIGIAHQEAEYKRLEALIEYNPDAIAFKDYD